MSLVEQIIYLYLVLCKEKGKDWEYYPEHLDAFEDNLKASNWQN